MIILDDDETQGSERSPLKSPVAPLTAARHDSSSQSAPPPYIASVPSSPHSPHHPHHPHHLHQPPQSPISPHHPHPHSPHHHTHSHPHHVGGVGYAGSVHSTTNLPPHIVKMIEEREIRQKSLYRFFSSFAVAFLIVLAWMTLIRGVTVFLFSKPPARDGGNHDKPQPPTLSYPIIKWPWGSHPPHEPHHDRPGTRTISWEVSVVITQPGDTITITPTPTSERILSIAYPPPSSRPIASE